jgi:two-component system sensor histidine kinase HydH
MLTQNLLFRIVGPTLFVSLLFLGSCITAALILHHQQSTSLRILDENIRSRQLVSELLRSLEEFSDDGSAVEGAGDVDRIGVLIEKIRQFADKSKEARLVDRLETGFEHYLQSRETTGQGRAGLSTLAAELVPICHELERFNNTQVDLSEGELKRTVAWVAWGLAGVGVVGSLIGLLFGYDVARSLGRSVLRAETLSEVGQLAAGMAHELRNPLTAIKMLVQTNREEAEAGGLPVEDLNIIEKEILRMEGRLNVFIDFARPPQPERRRVDLAAIVEETLALIGGRARKQRVSLRFDPPASPVEVEADSEQVRQLLVNLALNALDVMPKGGILEIQLHCPNEHYVELTVLDSGPGITPRHLPRLYEPFFTSKETGLGLGLVVSQRIAQSHGGRLRASNRPQGGACFVLRLPTTQKPS